jgi:hypothetical protein
MQIVEQSQWQQWVGGVVLIPRDRDAPALLQRTRSPCGGEVLGAREKRRACQRTTRQQFNFRVISPFHPPSLVSFLRVAHELSSDKAVAQVKSCPQRHEGMMSIE